MCHTPCSSRSPHESQNTGHDVGSMNVSKAQGGEVGNPERGPTSPTRPRQAEGLKCCRAWVCSTYSTYSTFKKKKEEYTQPSGAPAAPGLPRRTWYEGSSARFPEDPRTLRRSPEVEILLWVQQVGRSYRLKTPRDLSAEFREAMGKAPAGGGVLTACTLWCPPPPFALAENPTRGRALRSRERTRLASAEYQRSLTRYRGGEGRRSANANNHSPSGDFRARDVVTANE
jgi:hypothetical protein